MGVVSFEDRILIQGRQNYTGSFDAHLNRDTRSRMRNAELTLKLRLCLQPVNPPGGEGTAQDSDGKTFDIRAWRDSEWARWQRRFLRTLNRAWNGKFWLRPPIGHKGLLWPETDPTHQCFVACKFDARTVTQQKGAHAIIPVVRLKRFKGSGNFRSNSLLYSNYDIRGEPVNSDGRLFFTHVHEIGHLIGLDHPGIDKPECVKDGDPACYTDEKGDGTGIMGHGWRFYARHAAPWVKAAAALTNTREGQWSVSRKKLRPEHFEMTHWPLLASGR